MALNAAIWRAVATVPPRRHITRCATEDLKIEEFKPELSGKMSFYLTTVDEQLRHADDKPTIGLILCKGRHRVVAEYALRDLNKPMGVAQYQLTHSSTLPKDLQAELPTAAELSKEFPLFSLVKMRMDIERALANMVSASGGNIAGLGISRLVDALVRADLISRSAASVVRQR